MEVERCTHVSVNATRRALLCVAEQALYCYPRIKQELAQVELDIILRGSSTIDAPVGRTSVVSDPTAQRGVLLADSASVQRNRAVVRVIEDVFDSLPGNLKRLTRLIFWRHQSLSGAAQALGISRETARQWRADVVWRVAVTLPSLPRARVRGCKAGAGGDPKEPQESLPRARVRGCKA